MTLLQGAMAKAVYKMMKAQNVPLAATLRREEVTGLDPWGDPISSVVNYPCEGFVDDYEDLTRTAVGIPADDRRVNLFAVTLSVDPQIGDKITVEGFGWLQVRKVRTDPARAVWELQAFGISAP